MTKKKSKAKKDEIITGVKFPSKDELRKMYLTPDDIARIEEKKIIAEAKKLIK